MSYSRSRETPLVSSPTSGPGEIYQFSKDRGPDGVHNVVNDRIALAASPLKLTEVYALWKFGATIIWGHGFLAVSVLFTLDLSRAWAGRHRHRRASFTAAPWGPAEDGVGTSLQRPVPLHVEDSLGLWGCSSTASQSFASLFLSDPSRLISSTCGWASRSSGCCYARSPIISLPWAILTAASWSPSPGK